MACSASILEFLLLGDGLLAYVGVGFVEELAKLIALLSSSADFLIFLVGEALPNLVVAVRTSLTFSLLDGFLGYASSFAERRPGALVVLATFVVGASSTGMSLLGWNEDAYLFMLGTLAFSCALIGLAARRQRSRGWATPHIIAMSTSYVVPLTAFHVDNGHRLPLWKELPLVAFRIGPTLIAVPIVARALARHTHVRRHLRELAHLGAGPRGPRLIEPSTTDHQMADCGPEKTS